MTPPDGAPSHRAAVPGRGARRPPLSVPVAIVAAGALIGLGLYLGLREGAGARRPARVDWVSAPASTPSPAPSLAGSAPPSPGSYPTPALRASVETAAAEQLAAAHPELRRACWDPAVARVAEPAEVTLQVRITFDAAGRSTAFAVADPPDGSRLDVATCLRAAPITLEVPPPGMRVTAALQLHFPDPRP